jgi:hypothetical protein
MKGRDNKRRKGRRVEGRERRGKEGRRGKGREGKRKGQGATAPQIWSSVLAPDRNFST